MTVLNFKTVGYQKEPIRVYLDKQVMPSIAKGASNPAASYNVDKSAMQKRIAQTKFESQAYPVSNLNLKKSFKPLQITSRHMIKANYARSDSSSQQLGSNSRL